MSECTVCGESLRFYNCLDKYFHFLRHYNEATFQAGDSAPESAKEKLHNAHLVHELAIQVKRNKKLAFDDPRYKVPPGSKDWLEDKDLARLQRMLYRKDKKKTVVLKEEIEMIDERVEM